MTLPIPPVAPTNVRRVAPNPAPTEVTNPTESAAAQNGAGFTAAISDALNTVGALDQAVAEASSLAATGDLASVSDYMIAASEAQLSTEITVAIRDRAIAAFNDIMRMQI